MRKIIKSNKAILSILLCFVLAVPSSMAYAKSTARLNKKSATIQVGKTMQLKVNGTKKKVTWSSSNKKIATVTNKGKVNGIKAGKTTIVAKVNKNKLTCNVVVKKHVTDSKTAKNINTLKKYIIKNGSTNSDNNKFIKYKDDSYNDWNCSFAIVYEKDTKRLNFLSTMESDDADAAVSMYIDSKKVSPSIVCIIGDENNLDFNATGKFDKKTYTLDTNVKFKADNNNIQDKSVQNISNGYLRISFIGWDILLNDKLDIGMKDLGFKSYKSE